MLYIIIIILTKSKNIKKIVFDKQAQAAKKKNVSGKH